ncbi:Transcription activator AMTR1 [Colletotrichum sp. SAR11_59]|nr:Transcription activator AMTR1 [Colletotrichum sp. SAR11_59]
MVDRPPSPAEEGQTTRPRPHPPPPPTDPDPDQPPAKKKRTRTRTGCLNCRRKKRKCDEGRPACGGCSRRKERCEWGIKVTFRAENAQTILQDHPSMRKARRPPPRRHFEILDVTSEVIRDYHLPPGFHDYDSEPEPEPSSLSPPGGDGEGDRRKSLEEDETKTFDSPVSYTTSTAGGHTASIAGSNTAKRTLSSSGPSSAPTDPVAVSGFGSLLTPSTRRDDDTSDKGHAQTGDRMDFQASPSSASQQLLTDNAVANLIYLSQGGSGAGQGPHDHHSTTTVSGIPITTLALDPLIDAPFEFMDQMFTPEGSYEDGIFLPGSAYHELHSTLRNHLIQEVRSNGPTRPDGCASLMEAVGMNGFVGGVEQALFWCFARMDVCGGLISSVKTLIPVNHWASQIDLEADVGLFLSHPGHDMWANYAVYICAQVLDLLAPLAKANPGGLFFDGPRNDMRYRVRWMKLWRYVEDWHSRRPSEMQHIMSIPSSDTEPFPKILYSNPAAISGNQLYHTASLLMLQNRPASLRLSPRPRSALWHARQICGISMTNHHHGAWTNSVQPLWIAGRCMSHPAEHRAILQLLEKIEKESGWGTKWRADDLKEFWGDLGDG